MMTLPPDSAGPCRCGGGLLWRTEPWSRAPCCIEQLRDQRQSIGIVVNGQDVNRLLIPC